MKDHLENTILVVDDSPTNLAVLVDNLSSESCRVLTAESAKSALNRLNYIIPDLILLDVMMPEMDGFTLCRKLKENPLFVDIPVIFLTAKSDTDDILEGFGVGGVDYVTKPFHEQELRVRINTHLELKNAKRSIQEYAHNLEDKNKRLSEVLSEKNDFIGVATHDLKNPLSVLSLSVDLFRFKTQGKDIEGAESMVDRMDKTIKRMTALVSQLLEINQLDVGCFEIALMKTRLEPICSDMVEQNRVKAKAKSIVVNYETDPSLQLEAMVDGIAFSQIIDNLVSNAVKYSPSNTSITCRLEEVGVGQGLPDLILMDRKIRFVVIDEGPGIEEAQHSKVFQKFAKTTNKPTAGESSTGLGLSIARRLAKEMHGDLGFISAPGEGSTFYFELPPSDVIE